ncbi:hypothetical protein [Pseudomonas paeninsulae]|uniref:hypothetical protein n=1 Tax=Pseudomonas paeninsulae TaxID=3110772 RepID=UPI002D7962E6|nr:hypothetical protein [Pseudomonas sp. IT1137]
MKRFFNGLICLLRGCRLEPVTKTRVRLGDECLALHVCARCGVSHYTSEAAQ